MARAARHGIGWLRGPFAGSFPVRSRQDILRPMLPLPPLVSPRRRIAAARALGAVVAAAGGPAAAQTDEELHRLRGVFNEGRELETKKQWGDALKKFEIVAATKMTPQVRFHIALCEENLGKLVSAMKGFDLAAE